MNLFELVVKVVVDDQASDSLSKITGSLRDGLKSAAKIGTSAIGVAVSGITALTKVAVENYAEYEQLVGGVDTLFKGSSQKVQDYAANAFRTAGMSANEYMSTVTSFSASLLQSLGGDTEKAAEYADMAITDMSDNANKMGTSMELIQNAYQGFAKQNYTMLDNLKLGYGGTKSEMERLVEDAEKLNDSFVASRDENGKLVLSYADVVDAIHIVQDSMGITGTTAKEASSTISGSIASLKSAWSNLATGIANENADLEKLIDQFVESVSVAAGNLAPRVEIALDEILKLVNNLMPKIVSAIPTAVSKYAPKLINSGVDILKSLVRGIKNNAKLLAESAKEIVLTLIDGLLELIPEVVDAAVELLSAILSAFPEVAKKIANAVPTLVQTVVNGLVVGVIEVAKAAISLFAPIVDESEQATDSLRNHLSTLSSFNGLIAEFSGKSVDLTNALSENGQTIGEIEQDIANSEAQITEILKTAFETQEGLRQEDIANINAYNQKIREASEEKLSIYRDQQLAEYRKLMLDISSADAEGLAQHMAQAAAALSASNQVVEDIYNARLIQIENYHKANGTIDTEAYKKELTEAKAQRDEMLRVNQEYYDKTLGVAASASASLVQIDIEAFEKLGTIAQEYNKYLEKWDLTEFARANADILDALGINDDSVAKYASMLESLDIQTANAFISMQASIVQAGGKIDKSTAKIIETMLAAFEPMPGQYESIGTETLLALVSGLEEQIPALTNASEMTASEILNELRKYLMGSKTKEVVDEFSENLQNELNNQNFVVRVGIVAQRWGDDSYIDFGVDGSHANGLSYVPYDGYIAQLHKGERVLTASEAKGYDRTYIGGITINIDGAKYEDEQSLAETIAEVIQERIERSAAVYA